MQDVQRDLRLAREILDDMADCYDFLDSNRLYFKSNEPLSFIFSHFDFSKKDIFSVLGSSDQLFSFYCLGANSVSTFDIHRLTEYYYYLRRWSIEHGMGSNLCEYNNSELKKLIFDVIPRFSEETFAKEFWGTLLYEYPELMHSNLFFSDASFMLTPFNERENELIDKLPSGPLSFHTQDLFKSFSIDDTYDVVFISNILEYARGNDTKLEICRDNLDSLLHSNGIVIATNFMDTFSDVLAREARVFSSSFDIIPGEKRYSPISKEMVDSYYVYQKKSH